MNNDNVQGRYALSFTTGGLLARESVLIARERLQFDDWSMTRSHVVANNLLQARTHTSNTRLVREVIQRLAVLEDFELEFLVEASPTECRHIIWVAACRRYAFIGDFAEEMLRERFLLMNPSIQRDDFERFWAGKSLWHPELGSIMNTTKAKLRQNLFRMMQEAELVSDDGAIIPAVLSGRTVDILSSHVPNDLRFFPTLISAADLREDSK